MSIAQQISVKSEKNMQNLEKSFDFLIGKKLRPKKNL